MRLSGRIRCLPASWGMGGRGGLRSTTSGLSGPALPPSLCLYVFDLPAGEEEGTFPWGTFPLLFSLCCFLCPQST